MTRPFTHSLFLATFMLACSFAFTACKKKVSKPAKAIFTSPSGMVTTLAGGSVGYADGIGTEAQFYRPNGITIAADGTLYVADLYSSRIRKVTPTGLVTTLAGGREGYADGTGNSAQFYIPTSITVAPDGTLYVVDSGNNRIRKITPDGVVTTLAGGSSGYADGTGTNAQFRDPYGIAIAADGTLYVADAGNNRIRKVTPTGVVTTLAGSATRGSADGTGTNAQFRDPYGITIAADGTLYVADMIKERIRKITPDGVVTTLAGSTQGYNDGTGKQYVYGPYGITIAADGAFYVADMVNHRIRRVMPTGVITTLAGGSSGYADGTGATAQFREPVGIAIAADGTLYVADAGNNRIRKIK